MNNLQISHFAGVPVSLNVSVVAALRGWALASNLRATMHLKLTHGSAGVAVMVLLLLAPLVAFPAGIGPVAVGVNNGNPVLSWPNSPGQAYLIETTTNLGTAGWSQRVVITTDATNVSWADDTAGSPAMFYRLTLATNAAVFQTMQQALRRACTNQGIVGASAAAYLPQDGFWLGTYGTSDGTIPIRPQTPFEIGSVTKSFVSATILRLAEEGRLTLDDTVGQWLPGLSSTNIASGITIRQLLGHRSGVYNFGDDADFRQALFSDWSREWTPADDLAYVKAPYFPPGTGGEYSNTDYVLLGLIIQQVTGLTVAEEMRRTVLSRAGLRSTFLGAEESWNGPLADPHLDFNGDGIQEDLGALPQTAILTSFWTSGAEISTAADMVRFGLALFGGAVLNQTSLTEMCTFQSIDIGGTPCDYGLGLMRFNILDSQYWAHSGGLFGEYAWYSYCPSNGVCLAVAYNYPNVVAGPNLPGELLIALADYPNTATATPASSSTARMRLTNSSLDRFPFLRRSAVTRFTVVRPDKAHFEISAHH
jgi:D-alanyl-D-alanine carboxypeptidase